MPILFLIYPMHFTAITTKYIYNLVPRLFSPAPPWYEVGIYIYSRTHDTLSTSTFVARLAGRAPKVQFKKVRIIDFLPKLSSVECPILFLIWLLYESLPVRKRLLTSFGCIKLHSASADVIRMYQTVPGSLGWRHSDIIHPSNVTKGVRVGLSAKK